MYAVLWTATSSWNLEWLLASAIPRAGAGGAVALNYLRAPGDAPLASTNRDWTERTRSLQCSASITNLASMRDPSREPRFEHQQEVFHHVPWKSGTICTPTQL